MSILGEGKQEKLTWAAEPITQKGWRRATRRPAAWKLNQTESAREKVLEEKALWEVLGAVQRGFVKLSLLSVPRSGPGQWLSFSSRHKMNRAHSRGR